MNHRLRQTWLPTGRARRLCVLCLAIVLGGCLSTRFVFNQLDWFITWRLNSYFSLEKDQEQLLRATVAGSLEWLRVEQLPEYAELLRTIVADARAGTTTLAGMESRFSRIIQLYDGFLRHVVPDAVTFLSTLEADQVEYLIEKLAEENEELAEEYSGQTAQARLQRRERALIKNVTRFTGRLDSVQREMIREAAGSMHDNSEEWLAGRRAWQQDFRKLLLEQPPRAEFEDRLLAMSLDPNYMDPPEYRRQVRTNQRIILALMVEIINSLDGRQLARFDRRISGFASDFDALAAEAPAE